jgi:hypothetical protein
VIQLVLLFFGGLSAFFLGLLHPVGPALIILAISPFDPVMTAIFGDAGNYLSLAAPLLLLLRTPPGLLPGIFVGTRIQQAVLVFLLALLWGHIVVFPLSGMTVAYAYMSRVNVFLMMGVVAILMAHPKYIDLGIKVLVVSMAGWAAFSAAEFYLGIEVFPTRMGGTDVIVGGDEYVTANLVRLVGVGDSVPPNRLGMYFVPNVILALGWLGSPRTTFWGRIAAFACALIIGLALIGTISRSSYLGMAAAVAVALVMSGRIRITSVLAIGLIGGTVLIVGTMAADMFGVDQAVAERVTGDSLSQDADNRAAKWIHGMRLFGEAPITGVGYGVGETETVKIIGASDPHNSAIQILAHHGMMGFLPFVVAALIITRVFMLNPPGMPPHLVYWRPYMVAGIVGTLVICQFVSFIYDRYLWFLLGFGVAWERAAAQKIFEHTQAFRRWESGYEEPESQENPAPGWHGELERQR